MDFKPASKRRRRSGVTAFACLQFHDVLSWSFHVVLLDLLLLIVFTSSALVSAILQAVNAGKASHKSKYHAPFEAHKFHEQLHE